MNIAVLGGGKIGSTFAYQLAKSGHSVTVVARPDSLRLAQLKRDGGIVLATGESVQTQVADSLDVEQAYDLILVTMYDFQVEAVLPALKRSRAAAIQFMFVTFQPERLSEAAGPSRCSFGMPAVMARLDEDGKLSPKISSRQKTLHGDRRWMELFSAVGIPSSFDGNMPLWLRCHVPLTVAMESVSVAACQRNKAATWARAKELARGLHAGYELIQALGQPVYPRSKRVIAALPDSLIALLLRSLSGNKSFRELLANGAREARAHVDTMVAAAKGVANDRGVQTARIEAMRP